MVTLPPEVAAGMFYSDLEPEESRRWTPLLRPQSIARAYFRCMKDDSDGF